MAWRIAKTKSTGPFVLRDSDALVLRVMRKLGYLDKRYNSDLSEARFVFGNVCDNKRLLRDTGNLLADTDTDEQASEAEKGLLVHQVQRPLAAGPKRFSSESLSGAARLSPRCRSFKGKGAGGHATPFKAPRPA